MSDILVAIIDEDPTYVQVLNRVLRRAGFRTIVWTPGTDAFTMLLQSNPDLLVMDMQLGAHRGESVIERLQVEPALKQMAVMLCSTWAWLLHEQLLQLHPRPCRLLEKPFDLGDFLVIVRQLTYSDRPALHTFYGLALASV